MGFYFYFYMFFWLQAAVNDRRFRPQWLGVQSDQGQTMNREVAPAWYAP
jgi:hypothetical protein